MADDPSPLQQEKDRMDIFHKFFLVTRNEVLHRASIIPNPMSTRILDLGTGTGIWAIDMAEYVHLLDVPSLFFFFFFFPPLLLGSTGGPMMR